MGDFWKLTGSPLSWAAMVVVAFVGGFVAFSVLFPLASGAIATGELVNESIRLPVGHPDGGRIREVHVREGYTVAIGDPLISLQDAEVERQLRLLEQRAVEYRASIARLDALIAGSTDLPTIEGASKEIIDRHQRLLVRELRALDRRLALLHDRIDLKVAEIGGLSAVEEQKQSELGEIEGQVALYEELERRGAAPKMRVLEIRRQRHDIASERSETALQRQRAELEVNDAQLQYENEQAEAFRRYARERSDVAAELAEVDTSIASLHSKTDELVVRAPVSGRVIDLAFTGPGAVLPPNTEALALVPDDEGFVIEAKLSPTDVDRVRVGQQAEVSFSSLSARYSQRMFASLDRIAAGRTDTETGSFYRAWLTLDDEDLERLQEQGQVVSGAPVEVRINTGERTLASYLLEPLTGYWFKGMRES